jgi:SnoaL-like domain
MSMSMQEISDRLEIQDLMVRYSYAIDARDWDALDNVFTPDAHIDYSVFGGSVGDLPSTKNFLAEAMPNFPVYQHMVAGTTITFDGDTATTKTQCHNPMIMSDTENPDLMVCGLWYVDKLVRTPAGWRIKERVEEKCYFHNLPADFQIPAS